MVLVSLLQPRLDAAQRQAAHQCMRAELLQDALEDQRARAGYLRCVSRQALLRHRQKLGPMPAWLSPE